LTCAQIKAQRNNLNFFAGAMVVQGEASGGALLSDDMAIGMGFGFNAPLYKTKIEFVSRLEYYNLRLDYIEQSNPQNIGIMEGTCTQTSAGIGLNIYLNKSTNLVSLYQPFRPYISVLAGLLMQSNNLNFSDNFNFPNLQGTFFLPFGELGGGLYVRVNPTWSVNFNAAIRTTLSDEVDGLIGSTDSPDIMGFVRFGISYNLK
tara:strand:- start:7293 stop:7901 length:609 start_codon:yes stop_codon:yes gene_type:complete